MNPVAGTSTSSQGDVISLVPVFTHQCVFSWKVASPAKAFLPGRNDAPPSLSTEERLQVLQAPELLGERPSPAGELLQHLGQSGLHCLTPTVRTRGNTASPSFLSSFPASVGAWQFPHSPHYASSAQALGLFSRRFLLG